jgi:hypothetical protein
MSFTIKSPAPSVRLSVIIPLILGAWVAGSANGFYVNGEGKFRVRYITADTTDITGSYGEALKQGMSLRWRFDISCGYPLADYFLTEAGLRVTNENSAGALYPPDYITGKAVAGWWSVSYLREPLEITLGKYDASFTPLTFMRWDTKDNPLGASGCACQISVGGISGESLEEPQEDYRLEGARLKASAAFGDLTALFAQPQVPVEGMFYQQYLAGGRTRIVLSPFKATRSMVLGLSAMRVKDEPSSVAAAPLAPLVSDVFGADLSLPLIGDLTLAGEGAFSKRDDNLQSDLNPIREGYGLVAGLQYIQADRVEANLAFLQLDPWFAPFYRALSYAKNRRGGKLSLIHRDLELFNKPFSFSLYFKDWSEIQPTWNETITEWHHSLQNFITGNAGLNMNFTGNWHIEVDYEYRSTKRSDDASTVAEEEIDDLTQIVSLILSYDVTLQTKLLIKGQVIDHIDNFGGNDYRAYIPMLQFSMKF